MSNRTQWAQTALQAALLVVLTGANAHALVIDAVADTWIRESDPSGTYSNDLISVWDGASSDQRRYGVVMFDLSSTVGETIDTVLLNLYDRGDSRSMESPLEQQATLLSLTPPTFPANFEAYSWDEFATFDEGQNESALASLGAYSIAAGDTIGGYQPSNFATAGDIALLEQVRDAQSGAQDNLVVFLLKATAGERDWGDIEFDGFAPQLIINESIPDPGDFNNNGAVTIEDYQIMIDPTNWLQEVPPGTTGGRGDLTGNGLVDLEDFNAFKPIFAAANPGVALSIPVPEPTVLLSALAAAAIVGCCRQRRRGRRPGGLPSLGKPGGVMVAALLGCVVAAPPAEAVSVTESFDAWIRDEGLTAGGRDGDWLGVYNSAAGGGLPRWSLLEFDLSGIAPLTVDDVQLGFWHMFAGSPVGSSDNDPSVTRVSMLTEVGSAATPMADFTWEQLNDPGQVTLTEFESLGAIDLEGLAANPSEADRYHYGAGSAADRSLIQSLIDAGDPLRIVVRSDETVETSLRVDWGDGPDDGDDSHGMSAVLLINEAPPEIVELQLQINAATGEIWIANPGVDPRENTTFEIDGYVIQSPVDDGLDPLNPTGFTGLTGAGEADWAIVAPTDNALTELSLTSSLTLVEGDSFSLGTGYVAGAAEDTGLSFQYSVAGGDTVFGDVVFVAPTGVDVDNDGDVDGADFLAIQRNDPASINAWQAGYGTTPAAANVGVVPEPTAACLLLGAVAASVAVRRRR